MQGQALYAVASPCHTDLFAGLGSTERQQGILVGNTKPATLSW